MDRLELIALHVETLFVLDEAGDTLTSNEPYLPGRRRRGRLYVGWNEAGYVTRFRNDVQPDMRSRVQSWLDAASPLPRAEIVGLEELCTIMEAPRDAAGIGPAYFAEAPLATTTATIRLRTDNVDLVPDGFLEEGEIEFLDPSFAVVQDGKAVSTCLTVRRTDRSLEAGVDTVEAYRGRGLAVAATAAWVNEVLERELVPFYSTSETNTASQRVAEKLGLTWFASELGIL